MSKDRHEGRNGTSDQIVPTWKIENVVATGTVTVDNGKIDLNDVARKYTDCEYNPERFPGLVMRMKDPRATILLFGSGKMVITGLRKEDDAPVAIGMVIDKLSKAKIRCGDPVHSIENVVASGNLNVPVFLDEAAMVMENALYEPEVFPGLIYRMAEPKCCILLFSTGKFVCTGAKTSSMVGVASTALATTVMNLGLVKRSDDAYGVST